MRFVLLFALIALTWSGRAEATRRALVVGENLGLGPDAPLRFAEDDATAVATALTDVQAVRRQDMTLLTGTDLDGVRAALRQVAAESQPDDELIFFYSGHGGPDGAHTNGSVWTWNDVRADLEAVRARLVVAFFDACFSGALLTPKGLVRESPLVVSLVPLGGRGRYLVTSSGANELSYESGLLQGSPFAEALRSGVRGAADTNRDGAVTLPELYDYVYARTLSATVDAPTGPQHPLQSVHLDSAGEVVLVELRHRGTAPVRGSADLGRCYVLDRDGAHVVAEWARPTDEVFLAPAEYVVKCVKGDELLVARGSLGGAPSSIGELHYDHQQATGQLAKGGGAASESRISASIGILSDDRSAAILLGYRGGTRDLVWGALLGATSTGTSLGALGLGLHVPWWNLGRTSVVLGAQAACVVKARNGVDVQLGGGSFVAIETGRLAGSMRGFVRLDLLATEPLGGGSLDASLIGSLGVELGR
jgi:hypothetical protein